MITSPISETLYYKHQYWNNHPLVVDYMIERLRSDPEKPGTWWTVYFWEHILKKQPVERALFINCGNGWVDRDLYDIGIFKEGVGFDYSEALLDEARKAAGERNLEYFQADCNTVDLEADSFDLIVNVAAMHHVQYIDRLTRILAKCLKQNGYYLNYEYIGPHRNQYSDAHWKLLENINSLLPEAFRAKLSENRPDLGIMLREDPTEAIHSELIMETFQRYFQTIERKDLGGSIAYQIMYNNFPLYERGEQSDRVVRLLLDMDLMFTTIGGLPSLFSYFVGRPRKDLFEANNVALLRSFTEEEEDREKKAKQNDGRYDFINENPDLFITFSP